MGKYLGTRIPREVYRSNLSVSCRDVVGGVVSRRVGGGWEFGANENCERPIEVRKG